MNEKVGYQDIKHMTVAEAIEHMTHHLTTSMGEIVEVLAAIHKVVDQINENMP